MFIEQTLKQVPLWHSANVVSFSHYLQAV